MSVSNKRLSYICNDQQYDVVLYDDLADVGSDYLTIYSGSQPLYAKLGEVSNPLASHMRIYKDDTIYAILSVANVPTNALTSLLKHTLIDEILVDIDDIGSFVTEDIPSPYSNTTWNASLKNIDLSTAFEPASSSEYTDEQWFTFNSSTQTIEGYDEINGGLDVRIPPQIGGVNVGVIGSGAFSWKYLTSVTIPSTVVEIQTWAFDGNYLAHVTIPSSVINVRSFAFTPAEEGQITSVVMGSSTLANSVFSLQPITSITIGANAVIDRNSSAMGDHSTAFETFYYDVNNEQAGVYTYDGSNWSWTAL